MNMNQVEVIGFLQPDIALVGQVSILGRFKVFQADTIHLSVPSSTHCIAWVNSAINADDVASSRPEKFCGILSYPAPFLRPENFFCGRNFVAREILAGTHNALHAATSVKAAFFSL
jgi:hypothetical protein